MSKNEIKMKQFSEKYKENREDIKFKKQYRNEKNSKL